MKPQEVIDILKMFTTDEFQRCTSSEFDDAIYVAIEALEKADKYRWHDLRKNPDDLPEAIGGSYVSEYVFVMIGTPEWNHYEWAYYNHSTRMWSTSLCEQNVCAWRYIEPFEEEADEEIRENAENRNRQEPVLRQRRFVRYR